MGYVFLESSYRGEDGSQGGVEVCLGEVDDTLQMIAVARAQPYADPTRVGISGASHGGCITLRALERGVPVVAASDGFGITDMASAYAYWQQQLANDPGGTYAAVQQSLVAQLDTSAGGPPAEVPAAYTARSPIAFAATFPPALPMMIAHGTIDPLISVTDSCTFAAALGGFTAYHLDSTQTVVATAPAGCEAAGFTWQPPPLPTAWGTGRYLLIYDGVGHEFTSTGGMAMALQLVEFVVTKLGQ
jgi:dipeptidyl aminopeptidase/acylaminoacyl peptidase